MSRRMRAAAVRHGQRRPRGAARGVLLVQGVVVAGLVGVLSAGSLADVAAWRLTSRMR